MLDKARRSVTVDMKLTAYWTCGKDQCRKALTWHSTLLVAIDTARIALAPSLPLLSVPSSSNIFWSTSFWLTGFSPCRDDIEALHLHVEPQCILHTVMGGTYHYSRGNHFVDVLHSFGDPLAHVTVTLSVIHQ